MRSSGLRPYGQRDTTTSQRVADEPRRMTSNEHTAAPDTIVLIHGLWLTGKSWEQWADRYEAGGFRVIVESWPGMNVDIDTLRADTSEIDDLGVTEIADYYAEVIAELSTPPIIMGHSF